MMIIWHIKLPLSRARSQATQKIEKEFYGFWLFASYRPFCISLQEFCFKAVGFIKSMRFTLKNNTNTIRQPILNEEGHLSEKAKKKVSIKKVIKKTTTTTTTTTTPTTTTNMPKLTIRQAAGHIWETFCVHRKGLPVCLVYCVSPHHWFYKEKTV